MEHTPWPEKAIMIVRCSVCRKELPSEPVEHDDVANGGTSHGYCHKCEVEVMRDLQEYLNGN